MSTGADALRRRTEFPIPRAHRSSSYKKMLSLCRAALDKPDFVYLLTCITPNLSPAAFLNTSATSLYHPVADEVAMAKMDRCPICNVAVKPDHLVGRCVRPNPLRDRDQHVLSRAGSHARSERSDSYRE